MFDICFLCRLGTWITNTMDHSAILRNLEVQLTELEMLESMFSNPGEIRVGDANVLNAVRDFVGGKIVEKPPLLDITINLQVGFSKIELSVDLPHGYPDIQPEVYVRNQKLDRLQHSKLNKNLSGFLGTVEKGEPCIFSAVSWLQDNVGDYVTEQQEALTEQPVDTDENLARYITIFSDEINGRFISISLRIDSNFHYFVGIGYTLITSTAKRNVVKSWIWLAC